MKSIERKAIWVFALALMAVSALCLEGRAGDPFTDGLKKSGFYRVRFLNPENSPQTVFAVPDIDSGGADFDITVKCFVDDCERAAKFLNELHAARKADKQCAPPWYMKIDFLSFDKSHSVLSFAFDHTGTCFKLGGTSYTIREHLLWRLRNAPIKDW